MAKRTWILGEECTGGVIITEVENKTITIISKRLDKTTGDDQNASKELRRIEIKFSELSGYVYVVRFLNELTTYEHALKIVNWIKEQGGIQLKEMWG